MWYYSLLFGIILVVGLSDGKAISPKPGHCNQEEEYFHSDKSYAFKYEVVATAIANATIEKPIGSTIIRCDVHLNANGNCHYSLRVDHCVLNEGDGNGSEHEHHKSKAFSDAIERYPIEFSMSSGSVSGLLAHKDELISILNVKRGIITSLMTKKYQTKQDDYSDDNTELRTDVHGTCSVIYFSEPDTEISANVMAKDIGSCHGPTNVWRNNPFSLISNTSAIIRPFISDHLRCYYKYNPDGILENTNCFETYTMRMMSIDFSPGSTHTIAAGASIRTSLTLTKESSLPVEVIDKTSFISHHIQYEFEREVKPTENPTDLENKVETLLEKLSIDPEKPINAQDAKTFDELVDLLRKSSDLSVPNKRFGRIQAPSSNITNLDVQRGQIWSNALIVCNRLPCTRAFKALLGSDPEFVKHVISKSDLEAIFMAWKNAQINDFKHVKEILEIAETYARSRYIIIESSAILDNYWKHVMETKEDSHQDKIDQADFQKTFEKFLSHVQKSFDGQCNPNSGYQHIDVIAALKAITNIVHIDSNLDLKYLEVIKKCIHNKKAHYAISSVAIDVTSRMKPTPQLYKFLMEIFNDPTLTHVDHVTAYFSLAVKFGSSELVDDLLGFLVKVDQKGYDYNLRTFIVTHMRSVAKTTYPDMPRYSKAIREAMVYNSSLFRAIPDQISPKKADKNGEGIYIDDDLYFEKGIFSKYFEEHYNHDTPYYEGLGYGVSQGLLHGEDSHVPIGKWMDFTLRAFGKSFKPFDFGWLSKVSKTNVVNIFGGGNILFTQYRRMLEQQILHFPYHFNGKILTKLIRSRDHEVSKSELLDSVNQFNLFGNLISLNTLDEVRGFSSKLYGKFFRKIHGPYPKSSQYWKFIEGCTTIPTLAGVAVDFITDAHFINNVKLETANSKVKSKAEPVGGSSGGPGEFQDITRIVIDGSFSGLTSIKQAMKLDLKGFTNIGIQHTSTISTSVGAMVTLESGSKPYLVKVQLELPQRPLHFLRLTRNISLIKDHKEIDLPDDHVKPVTKDECSYTLASLLGIKLCHKKYFFPASHGKPCSILAGNAHWDYTAEYIANHKAALQFGIESKVHQRHGVDEQNDIEVFLKSRDEKDAEKFNTLLKVSHHINADQGEFKTNVELPVLPTFSIKAEQNRLPGKGYHFKAEATVYPGDTVHLDYSTETITEQVVESSLGSHLSGYSPSTESLSVPTTKTHLNITGHPISYIFEHKYHQFPSTTYADYKFVYKSPPQSRGFLKDFFSHPSFWEEDGTGWIKIRREVKEVHDHQCYNHVKLPKSTVKFSAFHGAASINKHALHFNLTKHDPITDEVLSFIRFKSSAKHTTKDGKMSYLMKANVSLPSTSLELQLRQDDISPLNSNYTLILRKEEPYYKQVTPWYQLTDDIFEHKKGSDPKISSFRENFRVGDKSHYTIETPPITTPFIDIGDIGMKEFGLNLIYHEGERHEEPYELDIQSAPDYGIGRGFYRRNFSMRVGRAAEYFHNFVYDSTLDMRMSPQSLLYKARIGSSPQNLAYHTFNVTEVRGQLEVKVLTTEDIKAETYESHMSWALTPTIGTSGGVQFEHVLDYTSKSETEPLLDLDVKLKHENQKTSIKSQDEFMTVDWQSNSQDGYSSVINFKSKNRKLAPNMRWQVHYPNIDQGATLQFDFFGISEVFYIFAKTELNATRLKLHICRKENCTKSDIDSENVVAQIELSLENPEKLTRTVIYNPQSIKFVKSLWKYSLTKFARGVQEYYANRAQGEPAFRKYFATSQQVIKSVAKEPAAFVFPFVMRFISTSASIFHFLRPTAENAIALVYMSMYELFHVNYRRSRFSWCTYEVFDLSYNPNDIKSQVYQPGPILGQSYVDTIALPVYWTHFNRRPLQWSPTFVGKFRKLRQNFINDGTSHLNAEFQDAKYSRHAFFSMHGDIYTFDGRIIHLNENFDKPSSYLLALDSESAKFIISYNDSSIELILPTVELTINSSGKVLVNETLQVELPFATNDQAITVTRKGDLIEVITPYDMKVICRIEHFYCIFYTNLNKFNKLIGLLGNNNGNPADDSNNDVSCEQEERIPCKYSYVNTDYRVKTDNMGYWWSKVLWYDESPTIPCHNIISPVDFFSVPHLAQHSTRNTLEDGYLALCRAKNVLVGRSYLMNSELRERTNRWSGYWESKIDDGVDVIFIVDLEYLESPEQIRNGVKKLADAIVQMWRSVGEANISFGLVGYKGSGFRHAPHQYTMNGTLLGTHQELINHALKTLQFDGPKQSNEDSALAAVEHAVGYYGLREKSHHVYILITPSDPVATQAPRIRGLVKDLLLAGGSLHLLSDFSEISFDGYNFVEEEHPLSPYLPKGALASLAAATEGSIWQIEFLDRKSETTKDHAELIASNIYGNGEKRASQCRQCMHTLNRADKLIIYCERKSCEFTAKFKT